MVRVTQRDIASKLGLSQQAVAFALSDNPDCHRQIHPKTRDRILTTARRVGYVPHHAARRMARSRSECRSTNFDQIGLIYFATTNDGLDAVCLAMMHGAEPELSRLGACLTFVRVSEPDDWKKVERLNRAGGVDGWLLYGAVNDEVWKRMQATGLPSVILGDHRSRQPVNHADVDNRAVGRLAAQHLASLGHRRVAFVHGRLSLRHVYQEQTLAGFRDARKEFGLAEDENLIVDHMVWFGSDRQAVVNWLRSSKPSAVITPEIDWASHTHGVLKDLQVRVPEDLSLLGCETATTTARKQNFTRIELPMSEVGRQGALLLHRIVAKQPTTCAEARISPSLITGWSATSPGRSTAGPGG